MDFLKLLIIVIALVQSGLSCLSLAVPAFSDLCLCKQRNKTFRVTVELRQSFLLHFACKICCALPGLGSNRADRKFESCWPVFLF